MQLITESAEIYHATAALTAGKLAAFEESPRLYHHRYVTNEWPRKASAGFSLGTLAHLLILEPQRAGEIRTDAPINEKTGRPYGTDTQKCEVWRNEVEDAGGIAASPEDLAAAQTMASHVFEVANLCGIPLSPQGPTMGALAEQTCRGMDSTVGAVQCRPDLWDGAKHIIYDLKTTSDLAGFKWNLTKYGYLTQAAWYLRLMREMVGPTWNINNTDWKWIVVESVAPFNVRVFTAPQLIQQKSETLTPLLERFAECRASGVWPLSNGYEFSLDKA